MELSKVSFTIDSSKLIEILKLILDKDIQDLEIEKSENKNIKESPLVGNHSEGVVLKRVLDKVSPNLEDFKKNTLVPNWEYHWTSTTNGENG